MTTMTVLELVLLILGLVAFLLAIKRAWMPKVNLVAVGLAMWLLVVILQTVKAT
jgi:hypothetical protein